MCYLTRSFRFHSSVSPQVERIRFARPLYNRVWHLLRICETDGRIYMRSRARNNGCKCGGGADGGGGSGGGKVVPWRNATRVVVPYRMDCITVECCARYDIMQESRWRGDARRPAYPWLREMLHLVSPAATISLSNARETTTKKCRLHSRTSFGARRIGFSARAEMRSGKSREWSPGMAETCSLFSSLISSKTKLLLVVQFIRLFSHLQGYGTF